MWIQVVVTSQLATKLLAADGSPATFDTGARAVMVPQLGTQYTQIFDHDSSFTSKAHLTYPLRSHSACSSARKSAIPGTFFPLALQSAVG